MFTEKTDIQAVPPPPTASLIPEDVSSDTKANNVPDCKFFPQQDSILGRKSHARSLMQYISERKLEKPAWDSYAIHNDFSEFKEYIAKNVPAKFVPKTDPAWTRLFNFLRGRYQVFERSDPKVSGFEELLAGLDDILRIDAGSAGAMYQNMLIICLQQVIQLERQLKETKASPTTAKDINASILKYVDQIRILIADIKKSQQDIVADRAEIKRVAQQHMSRILDAVRETVFELVPGRAEDFQRILLDKLGGAPVVSTTTGQEPVRTTEVFNGVTHTPADLQLDSIEEADVDTPKEE